MITLLWTGEEDVDLFYPNGDYIGTINRKVSEEEKRIIIRKGIIIFWKDQINIERKCD